jgi:hypothetical protein
MLYISAVYQSQDLLPVPCKNNDATKPIKVLQNSFLTSPSPNLKMIWGVGQLSEYPILFSLVQSITALFQTQIANTGLSCDKQTMYLNSNYQYVLRLIRFHLKMRFLQILVRSTTRHFMWQTQQSLHHSLHSTVLY